MSEISHYDLCEKTAKRFLSKSDVVLFEYNSFASYEFPDVLCFSGGYTKLFEIKVDYQDFKKDDSKACRSKYKVAYAIQYYFGGREAYHRNEIKNIIIKDPRLKEFVVQAPHLGRERFYVCPKDLIKPEEIKNGFGLYWFYKNKFYKKKESKIFRHNMKNENDILVHAFRKFANNKYNVKNILIRDY